MRVLKNIWKDPVGSKVIAAGIIFVASTASVFLYSYFKKITVKQSFHHSIEILNISISVPLWHWLTLITLILIVTLLYLFKKSKNAQDEFVVIKTPAICLKYDQSFMKFWHKMIDDKFVIVLPPKETDPVIKGQQIHSYIGLFEIQKIFSELQRNIFYVQADKISEAEIKNNIFSITGPIPNIVTRNLLNKSEIIYKFDGHTIINTNNIEHRISPILNAHGVPDRDYGIITRMKNPYCKHKDIVIACGCWGWGTQAALRILRDPVSLKYLNSINFRYFQIICTVEVDDKLIGLEPSILDIHPEKNIKQNTLVELYK